MATRRDRRRGKSEPQGQLAATTTSFGCSAGLSSMDVTKPQLTESKEFVSRRNTQPWLSAGFASQAATSSVTSADKKALLKGSVVNDGYKAYCGGMTPPLPDMLFHDVEASQTPGYKAAAPLSLKSSSCARSATHPWGRSKFKRATSSCPAS